MVVTRYDLEAALRAKVVKAARQRGLVALRLDYDGWPDALFLTPGAPTWLEFKRPGGAPRPLQVRRLQQLVDLGYLSSVAAGWTDDYDEAMRRLTRGT